jgi:hypothetical protein
METKTCETCGAHWLEGQLYWATGKPAREIDLAGLVCNRIDSSRPCANPCQGEEGGDTWELREKHVNMALDGLETS